MGKESVPVLHQVLSLNTENKPARLQLLSYAISENNLDEMIKVALQALQYNPEAMEFYYYLGIAYYGKKKQIRHLMCFRKE